MDEIVPSLFRCIQPLFRSKHFMCAILIAAPENISTFLNCFGLVCRNWQVETWLVVCWRVRPFRRKESKRQWQDWEESSELATLQYKHCFYKCVFQSGCFTLLVTAKTHGEQTNVSYKTNFCLVIWFHCC